jgi:hypothetical protein
MAKTRATKKAAKATKAAAQLKAKPKAKPTKVNGQVKQTKAQTKGQTKEQKYKAKVKATAKARCTWAMDGERQLFSAPLVRPDTRHNHTALPLPAAGRLRAAARGTPGPGRRAAAPGDR